MSEFLRLLFVEIAQGVRFLVTEADYMTGQSLNINGGIYMGW